MNLAEIYDHYMEKSILDIADDIMAIFANSFPHETYEEYDLGDLATEFLGHHEDIKAFDLILSFYQLIKEKHPILFDDVHAYYEESLVTYACFKKDTALLKELTQNMIVARTEYDLMAMAIKTMICYGYTNLVEQIADAKYEEVDQSPDLLPGASSELVVILLYLTQEKNIQPESETMPVNWKPIQEMAKRVGVEFPDTFYEDVETGVRPPSSDYFPKLLSHIPTKEEMLFRAIRSLELRFTLEMQEKGLSSVLSGSLWAQLVVYWSENMKRKSWSSFLRFEDSFGDFLDGQKGLILDYTFWQVWLLWGSVYVLDFFNAFGLYSEADYKNQKDMLEGYKQMILEGEKSCLWKYSFLHNYKPPKSVSDEAHQAEKELFRASFNIEGKRGYVRFGSGEDQSMDDFFQAMDDNYDYDDYSFSEEDDDKETFDHYGSSAAKIIPMRTGPKIGRNEKVTVRYTDGRLVENVKYKKVMDDVEAGKCEII